MCRIRWDRAVAAKERVSFVWDLVGSSKADFDGLSYINDAGKIPTLKTSNDDEFEKIYGLPRKLECKELPPRKSIESDWLPSVY